MLQYELAFGITWAQSVKKLIELSIDPIRIVRHPERFVVYDSVLSHNGCCLLNRWIEPGIDRTAVEKSTYII